MLDVRGRAAHLEEQQMAWNKEAVELREQLAAMRRLVSGTQAQSLAATEIADESRAALRQMSKRREELLAMVLMECLTRARREKELEHALAATAQAQQESEISHLACETLKHELKEQHDVVAVLKEQLQRQSDEARGQVGLTTYCGEIVH